MNKVFVCVFLLAAGHAFAGTEGKDPWIFMYRDQLLSSQHLSGSVKRIVERNTSTTLRADKVDDSVYEYDQKGQLNTASLGSWDAPWVSHYFWKNGRVVRKEWSHGKNHGWFTYEYNDKIGEMTETESSDKGMLTKRVRRLTVSDDGTITVKTWLGSNGRIPCLDCEPSQTTTYDADGWTMTSSSGYADDTFEWAEGKHSQLGEVRQYDHIRTTDGKPVLLERKWYSVETKREGGRYSGQMLFLNKETEFEKRGNPTLTERWGELQGQGLKHTNDVHRTYEYWQ